MKPSDDRKTINLSINETLSANELEALISKLAVVRANMLPSVPFSPPEEQNASIQNDPHFSVKLLRDGRIRLWLRNYGLGWMVFNIPVNKACALRDYLVANTPKNAGINFFSNNDRDGETSQ